MLSDAEVTAAALTLVDGKLTQKQVNKLVSSFRLLLGPLEVAGDYSLESDLKALDDSGGVDDKAAQMNACLIRLINEDFGVATLDSTLVNSDTEQRELFTLYAFSLMYPIPAELVYRDIYSRLMLLRRQSSSAKIYATR